MASQAKTTKMKRGRRDENIEKRRRVRKRKKLRKAAKTIKAIKISS
jgi:hypothetical protein